MMNINELSAEEKQFMVATAQTVKGNCEVQASLHDIGKAIGLDKAAASSLAQDLMGYNLLEVRTLSGGIGLTAAGLALALTLGAIVPQSNRRVRRLHDQPVIDDELRSIVEQLTADIKTKIRELELSFDPLNELVADLRSLDAQLASPKPKTAVIAACFESLKMNVGKIRSLGEQIDLLLKK